MSTFPLNDLLDHCQACESCAQTLMALGGFVLAKRAARDSRDGSHDVAALSTLAEMCADGRRFVSDQADAWIRMDAQDAKRRTPTEGDKP
jgi:Leu/Phe-tRNA-protein transferase